MTDTDPRPSDPEGPDSHPPDPETPGTGAPGAETSGADVAGGGVIYLDATAADLDAVRGVVWGDRAGTGRGYTLEAAAARLAGDITALREAGGIPAQVSTVTAIQPAGRLLDIHVHGLPPARTRPDRDRVRKILVTIFALASRHNIIDLDPATPPLFTQRVLAVDAAGRLTAALVGTGIGEVIDATRRWSGEPVAT